MKRRELYTVFFIIFVNFLYFFIIFTILPPSPTQKYPFACLAEWRDFRATLKRSASNQLMSFGQYPILGALYLFWVGQAALHSPLLFLSPFYYHVLYMGLFNVLFEIITVILTMRLVSRYFGQIYASNIMLIFILSPLVWWLTISRWDMLLLAFNICTLYFAVENKPWYAWTSLTIAILTKFYSIIFVIPLLFYYFERDGFKKTLIYVLNMITLGLLILLPFILIYGWDVLSYGISVQTSRLGSQTSIWYWLFLFFGNNEDIFGISVYVQAGIIVTYVLLDYFYERKKQNPLNLDMALIKRCSVSILIFMLTFKLSGYQYVVYAFPLLLIFINCFKKLVYFIFWLIALHVATYQTIIIYIYFHFRVPLRVYFLISVVYIILYTVSIALILLNKNLYENYIPILYERDFMLGLYNFVKKIKLFS